MAAPTRAPAGGAPGKMAAGKTAAADLMAQVSDSESDFDLKRNLLFFAFGGAYLGAFQYWHETAWKSNFGRHRRDVLPHRPIQVSTNSKSCSLCPATTTVRVSAARTELSVAFK